MTTQLENLRQEMFNRQLITSDGLVNFSKVPINSDFVADPSEEELIKAHFENPQEVITRTSLSLCKMAAEKVAEITSKTARSFVGHPIKVYMRGGTMRKLLTKTISRIFHSLTGCHVLALVKEHFNKITLDTDYLLYTPHCHSALRWHQIMEYGLVSHLTLELKKKNLRPTDLAIQLEQAHQKAKKFPGSYAYELAKEQGSKISAKDPDLEKKLVGMIAFTRAVDKSDTHKTKHYFERMIGHGPDHLADDFTFSNDLPKPARALDALCIDLEVEPLQLSSFNGSTGVIQAVFDAVLNNLTYDPSKTAVSTDFVRMLSFFMTGGSCFQKGWIDSAFLALVEEAKKQTIAWPRLLAKQLIAHTYNHYGEKHAVFICLAFNASALLLWKKFASREDIRLLWNLVFAELDKRSQILEGEEPIKSSTDLIEVIKMALRGGDCEFMDIYTQLQMSTAISMHQVSLVDRDYPCHQMLTDHHIFMKIQNKVGEHNYHLILPYDLPMSMRYAGYLYVNASHLSFLKRLHDLLNDKKSFFVLDQSPVKTFTKDHRLEMQSVLNQIEWLYGQEQEDIWWLGYLLSFSQLAQQKNDDLLKRVFQAFLAMLHGHWASTTLKEKAVQKMGLFFQQSPIFFDASIFDKLTKLDTIQSALPRDYLLNLAGQCMRANHPSFFESASEALDELSEKEKTIRTLMEQCLTIETPVNGSLIWLLQYIRNHLFLENKTKFLLILDLYSSPRVREDPTLELAAFKACLEVSGLLTELTDVKNFQEAVCQMFEKRGVDADPNDVFSFFSFLAKFKLINEKVLEAAWKKLLEIVPRSPKASYQFMHNCFNLAEEFQLWGYKEKYKLIFEKTSAVVEEKYLHRSNLIKKINRHETLETKIKVIHEQLNEWQTGSVQTETIKPFLEQIRMVSLTWEMRDWVFKTLQILSNINLNTDQLDSLRLFLKKFQVNHLSKPDELSKFWLNLLQKIPDFHLGDAAVKIRLLVIEQLFSAYSRADPLLFENSFFETLIFNLIEKKTRSALSFRVIRPQIYSLVKELHRRNLWRSILLFISLPGVKHHVQKFLKYVLEACQKHYEDVNSLETIEPLLAQISEKDIVACHLGEDYLPLWRSLSISRMMQNDFFQVFKWLSLESLHCKSEDFWKRSFAAIVGAVSQGSTRCAVNYLKSMPVKPEHFSNWVNVLESLLKAKEIIPLLSLVKERKDLVVYIKNERTDFIRHIIFTIEELIPFENSNSKDQINALLGLLYRLASQAKFSAYFWKKYIDLAVTGATLEFVEELFEKMIVQQKSKKYFLNNNEMIFDSWISLFKRLGQEKKGSKVLLFLNKSAPFFFSEARRLDITWSDFRQISRSLVKGGLKALQHMENDKERKKLALEFVNFLFREDTLIDNVETILVDDQGEFALNICEICLLSKTTETDTFAIKGIIAVLVMMDALPSYEEKAVLLTNEIVKRHVVNSIGKDLERLIFYTVSKALGSLHCKHSDYFLYLEFLLKHPSLIGQVETQSMLNLDTRKVIKFRTGSNSYMDDISRVLELIFSIPKDQISTTIPQKQIELVSQAVWKLSDFNRLAYANFLAWCSDQPAFPSYVRPQLQENIKSAKIVVKHNNLMTTLAKMIVSCRIIIRYGYFRKVSKKVNLPCKKELFPIEKRAWDTIKENNVAFFKRVASIVILASALFASFELIIRLNR